MAATQMVQGLVWNTITAFGYAVSARRVGVEDLCEEPSRRACESTLLGGTRVETAPAHTACLQARLLLSFILCIGWSAAGYAQVGGSLSGAVKDPTGGVVPGVSVTATNTVLGTVFSTITDGQGLYSFPKLPVAR